jgi:hypothetical protein
LALRLLAREIAGVTADDSDRPDHPVRLQRLEALWCDLRIALIERRKLRRTLAGALVTVAPDRTLTIAREPARRRPSQKGVHRPS